eukprot:CAMPEP_0113504810 /NCGR_PEP_ID=MMETSP0014_2-20120614/34933_1 /TAXON_ID=2857 /ORGANISM="Nitzschia sp." /LENGTH=173 /DNA_ID=CAMNT_0000399983 /DNA_START=18 /DNA_END=539 /DNA_ORIENTATION=- /assembly_acc=CAM_ASM_000159
MAEEQDETTNITSDAATDSNTKEKKTSTPPDGYVCNLCRVAGHWIQQCDEKKKKNKNKKKRKSSTGDQHEHEYQPGVDPSPKDIELARKMQQIPPPMCDCGIKSRLKKVKKSNVTENSRAVGSYFFFCNKKKDDTTKCNFAKPVDENGTLVEEKSKAEKLQGNFFAKKRKKVL